jgi:hypothetical protein
VSITEFPEVPMGGNEESVPTVSAGFLSTLQLRLAPAPAGCTLCAVSVSIPEPWSTTTRSAMFVGTNVVAVFVTVTTPGAGVGSLVFGAVLVDGREMLTEPTVGGVWVTATAVVAGGKSTPVYRHPV